MGRAERRHKAKPQNNFKHQEKRWLAHIREMVPKIYAGFALTLSRQDNLINAEELKQYVKDCNVGVGCYGDHQKEFLDAIEHLQKKKEYFDFNQIVNALSYTQDLWQSDGVDGFDIVKVCAEETGINLMSKVTADAIGVEKGEHETYDGVEM
jgi:hypothetical protein